METIGHNSDQRKKETTNIYSLTNLLVEYTMFVFFFFISKLCNYTLNQYWSNCSCIFSFILITLCVDCNSFSVRFFFFFFLQNQSAFVVFSSIFCFVQHIKFKSFIISNFYDYSVQGHFVPTFGLSFFFLVCGNFLLTKAVAKCSVQIDGKSRFFLIRLSNIAWL